MRKILNREVLTYLVAGIMTTVVNFIIYYSLTRWFKWNSNTANFISILVSIQFAFIVNEKYVFIQEVGQKKKDYIKLMLAFYTSRLIAMGVDMICFYIMSTTFKLDDLVSKVFVAVIIIVFNYLMSKFLVFRNRRSING